MSTGQAGLSAAPRTRRWTLNDGAARAALALLSIFAALPAAPAFQRVPGAQSGAALALGAEILRGRVLYREVWANEPPLTALLNALGLALGGPQRWGVWALELLATFAAALLIYELLRRGFGALPAVFGSAALLANLGFLSQRGSSPEGYALPLQIGAYLLLWSLVSGPRPLGRWLGFGILCGLLVSLRVELFSVTVTAAVLLLGAAVAARGLRPLLRLALVVLGLLLVLSAWAALFAAQGALPSLVDQVFRYNFFSAGVTNPDRIQAMGGALKTLYWASGFFALAVVAWLVALPFLLWTSPRLREALFSRWIGALPLAAGLLLLFNALWDDRSGGLYDFSALSSYRLGLAAAGLVLALAALPFLAGWAGRWSRGLFRRFADPLDPAGVSSPSLAFPLALALVDLPVQLVFASLAGQGAGPRWLPVLPALAILMTFLVWSLGAGRPAPVARQNPAVWLALLALPVLVTGWAATLEALRAPVGDPSLAAVAEIRASTRPDQPILQWGENPQLYFLAGRPSASRYLQQRPLFQPGYATAERVQALVEDLYATPPVILVDTRSAFMPLALPAAGDCERLQEDAFVEQLIRAERDARYPLRAEEPLPYYPAEMKAVYRWVCENYAPVPTHDADPDAWRLYRLHPAKP